MDKRGISLQLFILLVGISIGALFGIGIKSMLYISEDNFLISFIEQIFCKINSIADCRLFFAFTITASLFIGLLIFVVEHNRTGNWVFGMWIYVIGWILGSIFVYAFV